MGTNFDGMTHESMLEWLDQANSGEIQGAADRLVGAAAEIRKIAEDLKVRPQWVEWKGKGADAFRTWSADLANATLRLGDYSEGASKWLGEASNAVASAQASIPRTEAGAQADVDAALAARNDPDASAVAKKSAETLIASREKNRDEAAAQMRRLAESYSFSSSQMSALEKPVFPAMPQVIAPDPGRRADGEAVLARPAGTNSGGGGAVSAVAAPASYVPSSEVAPEGRRGASPAPVSAASDRDAPTSMAIDGGVAAPMSPHTVTPSGPGTPMRPSGPEGGVSPSALPGISTGLTLPPNAVSAARMPVTPRLPTMPGPAGPGGNTGGRLPRDGITGGRAVTPNTGRPVGGIPRGTVIGGEGTQGRTPMGHAGGLGGAGSGQGGVSGGRRLAGETGGVTGGRPQQARGAGSRPFTPGGSGLVRGGATSGSQRGPGATGRGPVGAPGSRSGGSRRDERGERPDYLVEDEETWQQGSRRIVPPVID